MKQLINYMELEEKEERTKGLEVPRERVEGFLVAVKKGLTEREQERCLLFKNTYRRVKFKTGSRS